MTRRLFNRLSLLALVGSLGYTAWFSANLEWHRFRQYGISADLPPTWSSYVAFVLPIALLVLYLVLRRLLFDSSRDVHSAEVLFDRLRSMALPSGSYAIFGSGPLAARGLLDDVGDLDVVARGPTWSRLRETGETVMYGNHLTIDFDNGLTFGNSWAYGDFDLDKLIDEAEIIEGLPFVRLEAVVEYKRIAGRPKDLRHIDILRSAGLI